MRKMSRKARPEGPGCVYRASKFESLKILTRAYSAKTKLSGELEKLRKCLFIFKKGFFIFMTQKQLMVILNGKFSFKRKFLKK